MKEPEMVRDVKDERRASTRVAVHQVVANSRVLSAESAGMCRFTVWPISDISLGGMCVRSEEKMAKHALAFLNVDLDALKRTVSMIAKVIWCRKRPDEHYDIGLTFAYWPEEDDKKQLKQFMYTLLAEAEK